ARRAIEHVHAHDQHWRDESGRWGLPQTTRAGPVAVMNNDTAHTTDPNYRFDRDPMWDTFRCPSERLGINVGSLWRDPRSERRIRSRLLEAMDGYPAQLPDRAEPVGINVPVAHGVTADAVWTCRGEVVIDEIDQECLFGHEPHFVRRVI